MRARYAVLLILSILLAGALSYACIRAALSRRQTAVSAYIATALTRPTQAPPDNFDQLLNLNTATASQLMELPGIGKKLAQSIVSLRADLGQFHYKEELLLIYGLGEKKLDAIYDLIYVK